MFVNSPKVIVRMVASNSEETIARAIESALNQTYTNLELHVCIRGSTDNTAEIVNSYARIDSRVRAIINKDNWIFEKGNDILDYYTDYDIKRDYVCFMDGDDEYKPRFLEDMLAFAGENDLDIAACGNDVKDSLTGLSEPIRILDREHIISGDGFSGMFPVYHKYVRTRWAKLFRLSLLDKADRSKIFWLYFCDDTVEVLEYFRNAKRIGILPQSYYIWYYYHSSVTHRWDSRRTESDRMIIELTASYLLDKTGYITTDNYAFLCRVYFRSLTDTLDALFNGCKSQGEIIQTLHDIITCNHTRRAAEFTAVTFDCSEMRRVFNTVSGQVLLLEKQIETEHGHTTLNQIKESLKLLSGEKVSPRTAALWALENELHMHDSDSLSILEISGYDERFGRLIRERNKGLHKKSCTFSIDRVDMAGSMERTGNTYNNVYDFEILNDIPSLNRYDIIVIFHLFENTESLPALEMLKGLLFRTSMQVLVLTPEYPYNLQDGGSGVSTVRAYHPLLFKGMDFSYKMLNTTEGAVQAYSFFTE